MASVFGYAGLKSRLSGWRGQRSREHESLYASDEGQVDLSLLLENLVIPQLLANSARAAQASRAPLHMAREPASGRPVSLADIDDSAKLCVDQDAPSLFRFVEHFLEQGHSVETIYIDLLAPAARRLGEEWESDGEDFVAVTMGLWRIQELLRELTLRVPPHGFDGAGLRSALFSTMPGEQHSLGTLMVAECFERAGWQTDVLIEPSQSELTARVARHSYHLVGLTVSCDCSSASLAGLVTAIRAVSDNPRVKLLVGGRAINAQPDLVNACGADGTAIDAPSAVAAGERLVPVAAYGLDSLL